jgi:hypothetical protein
MTEPLVSVVNPVHSREYYFGEAIICVFLKAFLSEKGNFLQGAI